MKDIPYFIDIQLKEFSSPMCERSSRMALKSRGNPLDDFPEISDTAISRFDPDYQTLSSGFASTEDMVENH